MPITYYNSPIGKLYIEEVDGYITYLSNVEEVYIKDKEEKETETLVETKRQLDEYFQGKRKNFNIPLKLKGTPYQEKVWKELLKIPYGTTNTYGFIAEAIGNKKGSRSVGMACGKNNIMIIVPCHRVIGKSKKLTGYAGGIDVKEQLLLLENNRDWKK